MITVQQASEIIGRVSFKPTTKLIGIGEAVGHVLAETITADRDLPPFHRSTMDGIAIAFTTFEKGVREFAIEGVQAAGQSQKTLQSGTGCFEIMTGAMIPEGTDTVVRYEDVTIQNSQAKINVDSIDKGQSIHKQGIDANLNDVLLTPGQIISPAEIALLASVGKSTVLVFCTGSIAVVTTGDELVPIESAPQAWEIRRSNSVALLSALSLLKISADLFHLPDNPEEIERELSSILSTHDIVILSGGVSKGKFDYVPGALEKLGIKKQFHIVKQRPGKPFWFGRSESKTVFALPGNPVSTFMCYYKYIKPWLETGMNIEQKKTMATLARDFTFKPDLTYFLQVKLDTANGVISAQPAPGEGSGDFTNLNNVDGFIELPSERNNFQQGELFHYIPFRA